ncbi:hypothetical protein Ancab_040349 [Ancistrocladus abbreviatus]
MESLVLHSYGANAQQNKYGEKTEVTTLSKEEEEKACLAAMAIATGNAALMVLKTVIELGVLEIIKNAGLSTHVSATEIVNQLPTTNPNATSVLERMLRHLAGYSLLTHSRKTLPDGRVERLYGLTPVTKYLTNYKDGFSFAPLFIMLQDKVLVEGWSCLKDVVLNGGDIAFNSAHGIHVFDYCGVDPRFNDLFNAAMSNYSTITMMKILESYDGFKGISTLVDVGGGVGATLNMILSKYPTIKGINFDLPHVIEKAPSYPGVEHVGGSMFTDAIPKGDAIFTKLVFHSWTDEECLKIFKNCYLALPDHGKVIVCEHLIPADIETRDSAKIPYNIDANMLTLTSGKERTKEEFEALAKQAGFEGFRVACFALHTGVMEFIKKY